MNVVFETIDQRPKLSAIAASLPELSFDCGLGTASLLAADVTDDPLVARDGRIAARRVLCRRVVHEVF